MRRDTEHYESLKAKGLFPGLTSGTTPLRKNHRNQEHMSEQSRQGRKNILSKEISRCKGSGAGANIEQARLTEEEPSKTSLVQVETQACPASSMLILYLS